jgi:aryl-alcohol dehydrogenase-like predicted oxidoreductase
MASAKGVTLPQIAVAYMMNQPMNIFALISSQTEEQFATNAAALDIKLTPQELAYLDLRADSAA